MNCLTCSDNGSVTLLDLQGRVIGLVECPNCDWPKGGVCR